VADQIQWFARDRGWPNINSEHLSARLQRLEESTRLSNELEAARSYAGGLMCEVINPLEALNNLIYLLKQGTDDEKRSLYIKIAETELARLNEIAQRTLRFCKE
jgi:nitrogen-specific signal transduction histidine kinase